MKDVNKTNDLKKLLKVQDNLCDVYDYLNFSSGVDHQLFDKIKDSKKLMQQVLKNSVVNNPDVVLVVAEEDMIIKNEQVVKIATNISGSTFPEADLEILFEGFIPTNGYLQLTSERSEEDGIQVLVENMVSKKVYEKYDCCGYQFSSPESTHYYGPGIYLIQKDQILGVAIVSEKAKTYLIK